MSDEANCSECGEPCEDGVCGYCIMHKANVSMIELRVEARQRELRDRFAIAALTGLLSTITTGEHYGPQTAAQDAYKYADAMLKERAK